MATESLTESWLQSLRKSAAPPALHAPRESGEPPPWHTPSGSCEPSEAGERPALETQERSAALPGTHERSKRTSEQDDEEMARIDDGPMARLREIQKRQREEKGSTSYTAPAVPNIPGLKFREKRPRKTTLSLEEMRAMRQ